MQRILELFAVHLSFLNVAGLLKRTVFVKQMILLLNILTCKTHILHNVMTSVNLKCDYSDQHQQSLVEVNSLALSLLSTFPYNLKLLDVFFLLDELGAKKSLSSSFLQCSENNVKSTLENHPVLNIEKITFFPRAVYKIIPQTLLHW